jgi:hypothetical protein
MRYIRPMDVDLYRRVRSVTEALAAPLTVEDQTVQTMPDVSPTKWHLAHTSWFFETFLLRPYAPGYRPLDERYATLFNSYYIGAGDRFHRPSRGHLSRPTVDEILAYRRHVDEHMQPLLADPAHAFRIELGLNHEEQHQELILTDIKHVLGTNPLHPALRPRSDRTRSRLFSVSVVHRAPGRDSSTSATRTPTASPSTTSGRATASTLPPSSWRPGS